MGFMYFILDPRFFQTFFSLCLVRLLFPVYEVFNVLGTFSVPCRLSRTSNILSLPISLVNTFFTFFKSFLRPLLGILDGVFLSPLVRRLVFIISYPFSYWQVVFSFFMINCQQSKLHVILHLHIKECIISK